MTVYARGALGAEVERIQRALKEHDLYGGPVDGNFGRGTELAAQAFQRAQGFGVDGVVGQATWGALFRTRQPPPAPTTAAGSLAERCFALTGAFETASPPPECFCGLSGDFDGRGLSFGALQWCIGQDSL